jgi:hypothetical protein
MRTGSPLIKKTIIISPVEYFVVNSQMKTLDATKNVEDTPENFEICKKYCGSCPTYKSNKLSAYPPNALFCARGKSSVPSQVKQEIKKINCYCPACEIFTKCGLTIGYFCAKH